MRLSRMHGGFSAINIFMHSCIFQIRIWLSPHNAHGKVQTLRFLTCMRRYNQECINKSENAANRAPKSSNTGPELGAKKRTCRGLSEREKAFISETAEEKRGVMWWMFGLSCFTAGGGGDLRQMRGIAKSSQTFQGEGENGRWDSRTADGAPHIKISRLKSQCEISCYGASRGKTARVTR